MSQAPLLIRIPTEHLPATICSFLVKPGDKISKAQSLLSYEYNKTIQRPVSATGESDVSTPQMGELKSPTEGEIEQFHVKPGETIDGDKVIVGVIEPCSHSIQIHGLCALCGVDITTKDHNGIEYAQRATISMGHNVVGLTVSLNEAERLEKETSSRLLEEKKLSLIVDLDQTLIQATVDPSVEEWTKDENSEVAKDICKFVLPDSPSIYYIKLRPGLKDFLKSVSKLYEPHIYTMGTRNYASAVANVIDPDNTIFNERILSRDESGSLTQKTIRRLFPCDDSMVVVIDDRADVWDWSPNLIKVHPYDFFVGIGDINDTYLPKTRSVPATSVPKIVVSGNDSIQNELPDDSDLNAEKEKEQVKVELIEVKVEPIEVKVEPIEVKVEPIEVKVELIDEDKKSLKERCDKMDTSETTEENDVKNDKVSKDASISEEKSAKEPLKVKTENNTSTSVLLKPAQPAQNHKRSFEEISEGLDNSVEKSAKKQQLERNGNSENEDFDQKVSFIEQKLITDNSKPILTDDDTELPHLLKALEKIHKHYYDEYDRNLKLNDTPTITDVTFSIRQLKRQVLKGVNILFTHVIPTNQNKETTDIWILAEDFGAVCSASWNNRVTHLVAGDRGTEKVKEARRKGGIHVVRREWLDESIKKWERQSEKDYTLEPASPRDSESGLVSEVDKPPELMIETPSGNELTDDDDLLLSPKERQDHYDSTDWRSALNEVEDVLAESGDTSAIESETETESSGRKGLKRYGDALDVDDRAKRLKQSPLRQSITFGNGDENESEKGIFNTKGYGTTGEFDGLSEHESESFYQDSELIFEGDVVQDDDDVDADEIEHNYDDEEADGDYDDDGSDDDDDYDDAGNQSDDEDDYDFDDDDEKKFAEYFEENLRQPNDGFLDS